MIAIAAAMLWPSAGFLFGVVVGIYIGRRWERMKQWWRNL